MKMGEIKDVVRDILGRDVMQGHIMDLALASGRREIEKKANFYWMRSSKTWNITAGTNLYPITVSTGVGLNLPNFKDIHALFSKQSSTTQWDEVLPGDIFQLERQYQTDAPGQPRHYVVDNVTLRLYPPEPESAFNMSMFHFEWTTNPTANSGTSGSDELTDRWPEALIYSGCIWGFVQVRKDEARAQHYRGLLELEIKKMQEYNLDRMLSWRVDLVPHSGAMTGHPFINANKSISPWGLGYNW